MSSTSLPKTGWGLLPASFASAELLVLVATFSLSWAALTLLRWVRDVRRGPPGPWGFPLIGHLPLMGKQPHINFTNMRKTYGDVVKIRMGSWPTVVVSGRRAIRQALVDRGDDFSSRPTFHTASVLRQGVDFVPGLGFDPYDARWMRHRKVANSVLFAFSNAKKNPLEQSVQEEVDTMMEDFRKAKGKPVDPHDTIYLCVGSIIYQICYGRQQHLREDKDFNFFLSSSKDFTEFTAAGNPVDVMPWLRFILPSKAGLFQELINKSNQSRDVKIAEHRKTFDSNNLRDVCDGFLDAAKRLTPEDRAVGLNEEQLVNTLGDIFGAGFDTTATTLHWAVMFMAKYPEIQAKVHEELDRVLGTSQRPQLSHKSSLPYTDSVILEVLRFVAIAPMSLPHLSLRDTQLDGYFIPKGTVLLPNLYSVCHDPEVWGDPGAFRPERFLSSGGQQVDKALMEQVMVFSVGRRKCLGEALARMELFLFFASFMQRLRFLPAPGQAYPLEGHFGLTSKAQRYQVIVEVRE